MKKRRIIDIGSNSIRSMEVSGSAASPVFSEKSVFTTRLAGGLLATGRLSEDRMQCSLDVLCALGKEARAASTPICAYATSAVRDASNRELFVERATTALGVRPEVLSGRDEAAFAYRAATGGNGGLIDIGGGSTQVMTQAFSESFPIGCVRAKDVVPSGRLEEIFSALPPVLEERIALPVFAPMPWTGVGGTITTLAAYALGLPTYSRSAVQGAALSVHAVEAALRSMESLGGKRSFHPLLTKRHDVILQGGAILLYLMQRIGMAQLRVSDADGLEGYALHVLAAAQ